MSITDTLQESIAYNTKERVTALEMILYSLSNTHGDGLIEDHDYVVALKWLDKITKGA